VVASDLGIAANCLAMAFLLDRRRLVSARLLDWGEIAKALVTALLAGLASARVARFIPVGVSRVRDLEALLMIGLVWISVVLLGLWLTKSKLLEDLGRRPEAGGK
jgi:hypothetical protein